MIKNTTFILACLFLFYSSLCASEVNKAIELMGYMFCLLNIFLSFVIFGISGFESYLARVISFSIVACILIATNITIIYSIINKHFFATPLFALSLVLIALFSIIAFKDLKKQKLSPNTEE